MQINQQDATSSSAIVTIQTGARIPLILANRFLRLIAIFFSYTEDSVNILDVWNIDYKNLRDIWSKYSLYQRHIDDSSCHNTDQRVSL